VAQCFATGDVDENGTLDLFTGSDQAMTADTLVMQRGYGDGTFFAAQFIQGAGAKQGSIALGDLNRDGHLDLAVSTFSGGFKVWLLLGNGAGGFPFSTSWGTGLHPLADLAIGDFNSDDKLDLAVVDASADDIVILSGRGDGTLEPEVRFGTGGDLTEQLAVADFDQDGRPDIAVTSATTNDVRILLNEGNHRPIADAGADRVVETDANGYAVVALDGSGSVDADSSPGTRDDIQVFQWFNGLLNIANGEQASVTLASGPYTLALRVVDREDSRDLDDASVVVRDNCPGIPNPEQTDADLDGHGAACDCLDSDPAAWTSPSESSGLSLDRGAGETVILSWDDPSAQAGPGTVHDIVTGSLAALRAQGGFAGATCAASGVAAAPATIPLGDPATGDAAYMLVRGRNPCGSGSYGNGSGGERVVTACP
jgi:hypothetical protein